jgi:hypothetical protein
MIDPKAIVTAKNLNPSNKVSYYNKLFNKYLRIISKKYPDGIKERDYFSVPGYEHVTTGRPIIKYSKEDKEFYLTVENFI